MVTESATPQMYHIYHPWQLGGNRIHMLNLNNIGNLKQLRFLYLSSNKLSSLPQLGGATGNIIHLQLSKNFFYHVPSFANFSKLTLIDLSWNYITSVPQQSLPTTITPRLKLDKNPIECLSGHCWTTSQDWMNKISIQCADGKALEGMNPEVLCQGNTGLILGLRPANERLCYFETTSPPIGWAQA